MQMDTCKIRPGLYQFTAIDDCSRFLVAGVARHRNAKSTLAFLDQVLDEMPFSIQRVQHRQSEDNRQFPGGLTLTPIDRLVGWRREAPGAV